MASTTVSTYFDKNDRFIKYYYTVDRFVICYPDGANYGKVELPTERITSFSIVHDYENNIFPIFRITLTLTSDQYWTILKWARGDGTEDDDEETSSTNRLKFYIDIRKYYIEVGSTTKSDVNSKWIADYFYLILDDDAYDSEEGLKEAKANQNPEAIIEDTSTDMFELKSNVEFFFFRAKDIKASRKVVSCVLPDCSVANGLNYIISKATPLKKILMSRPSSRGGTSENIPELLIPPLTVFNAIQYLDCYYGIYDTGSMMYADFDRFYLLHYWYKADAYEDGEWTKVSFMVPKKGSSYTQEMCMVDKANNANKVYYMIANNDSVTIKNEATTYDVLAGNDIEPMVAYDAGATTTTSTVTTSGGSTYINVTNYTENPFFNDTYTAQTDARGAVIDVELAHINVAALKPNRQFNIIFEDTSMNKKYNGYYKMVYAQHNFVKQGDAFECTSHVTIKCMKSLSDTGG